MNTVFFDKKVKCNDEFVALRILENCDDLKTDGIWLPSTVGENERLAHCVIEDVGAKAASEYGIKAGDHVMIDRLSTFGHTAPVCTCRYNNVICFTDENMRDFRPLRNMLFVEPDSKGNMTDVGGVYIANDADKLNIGTITAENLQSESDSCKFKVGDRVLLTKGPDTVEIGDRIIYIYKHDMLVCKIEQ